MGSGIWTLDPEWAVLFGKVVEPLGGGAWRLEDVSWDIRGRLRGLVASVHSQVTLFASLCVAEMWSLCSMIQPSAAGLPPHHGLFPWKSQNILFFKLLLAMGLCHSSRNVADKNHIFRLISKIGHPRSTEMDCRRLEEGEQSLPLPVATHWLPVCGVLQAYHRQSFLPSAVAKSNRQFSQMC